MMLRIGYNTCSLLNRDKMRQIIALFVCLLCNLINIIIDQLASNDGLLIKAEYLIVEGA